MFGALKGAGMGFPRWKSRPQWRSRDAPGCRATTLCGILRGGRGAPVPTPERSGRALLAELLGSSSSGLWQPAGIQDLSQCPLSLDPLQLSGSAALAAVGSIPVGMMIHRERPLLHGWM